MKLSNYIYDVVYGLLQTEGLTNIEKGDRPDGIDPDSFYSIKPLPLPADVYQNTYLNINCHAKDAVPGKANRAVLDPMAESVQSILLRKYLKIENTSVFIELDRSEIIREEKLNEHYFNLRFKITIANN